MSFDPAFPSYVQPSLVLCHWSLFLYYSLTRGRIMEGTITWNISLSFWLPDVEVLCNKTQASPIHTEFSASLMAGLHVSKCEMWAYHLQNALWSPESTASSASPVGAYTGCDQTLPQLQEESWVWSRYRFRMAAPSLEGIQKRWTAK